MTVKGVAKIVDGILNMDSAQSVSAISTDTRTMQAGCIYIALRGERFDGHDYIEQAFAQGASAVISERMIHSTKPIILVRNTKKAFGKIAAAHRREQNLLMVAVTGSVGKTSTKEMIATILGKNYSVHKTAGNLNNEIGLPHTLLAIEAKHEACVLEMGMSAAGEISYLSKLSKPDIAVITNIGVSHIETLVSRENILSAKMEILDGLASECSVVLNVDDAMLAPVAELLAHKAITFGIKNKSAMIRAEDIKIRGNQTLFTIVMGEDRYSAKLPTLGTHNVYNGLAGVAVGLQANLALEHIIEAMQSYQNTGMRGLEKEYRGVSVLLDCYNASPDSMKAALEMLSLKPTTGRRIAVLGDMLELGKDAVQYHQQVGKMLANTEVDLLVCCGTLAQHIAQTATAEGAKAEWFVDQQETVAYLKDEIQKEDTVLFKASRGMAFEQMVSQIFEG